MSRYDGLKKFIPVLDAEAPIDFEEDSGTVSVEYPDVVFRFLDALEAFLEKYPGDPEEAKLLRLKEVFLKEEECPGVVAGFIMNGALAETLASLGKGE